MATVQTYQTPPKWTVETYNTGSSLWQSASSWPRSANEPFSENRISTTQVIPLADGNEGLFTPSTRYTNDIIRFNFNKRTVTNTFKSNIETYQNDHTGVRITLHDGQTVQGYVLNMNEQWEFSGPEQYQTLSIEFKPFSIDGESVWA